MIDNRALAPQMIGRQAQLDDLQAQLALARVGSGGVVFVAGDAGVGKSRLVREFVEQACSGGGVRVLEGRCYDENPAVPYGPFIDALRYGLRTHGAEAVVEAAGSWLGELARLLPELQKHVPATAETGDPQAQKWRLFEAIASAIRPSPTQRSRIVVLEDLHWSDQTSQELIQYLAHAIERERVLVLATYRTDELHRRHPLTHLIAQLTRERLLHEVRVLPLDRAELAQMLHATLQQALPDRFVHALYERTEGNPFFVEEILTSLIEQNQLDRFLGPNEHRTGMAQLDIPLSVKDSILGRLVDLDATTTEVLRYAAVIGRRFDWELLQRLTGLEEAALLRTIETLIARQLVIEEANNSEDYYSFRHALTREAVRSDLLHRERRMRHRAVLHEMEQLPPERRAEAVDQLAYHSVQARELAKAAHYTRLAGDRAARMYAYREALAHYEAALDLMDEDGDARARADLLATLGHTAYPLGDTNICARYWHEAQQLYEHLGDRRTVGDLWRWFGRAAWERGDKAEAFDHTRTALGLLEQEPPSYELAMAYSAMSQLFMLSAQPRQGIEWGEKALRLADELDDVRVKTHALNNIGCSLVELGEGDRGIAILQQSLALAQKHRLIGDTIRAYHNLGMQLAGLGQIQRAAVLMREGIAFAERVGWEAGPITLLVKAGWVEMMLGNWARAQHLLDRALSVTAVSNRTAYLYALMHIGVLHLRRGQLKEAQRLLEAALPEYERIDHPDICGASWAILAEAAFRLGDINRAVACMDRCVDLWHDLGAPLEGASFVATGIEIYAQAHQFDKLQEVIAAVTTKERSDYPPMATAILADSQGLSALYEERYTDSAASFARAITLWQQLGLPFEESWSRRRRAGSLLRLNDGSLRDEARRELATTRQIFERLGAALELEQIDAVMKRSGLLPRPNQFTASPGHGLTRREREVIALIARGYSNRAIAEALVISEKTAEIHVSNILGKLGVASRTQAAAHAIEHGIVAEVKV